MGRYFGRGAERLHASDPPIRVRCGRRGWTDSDLEELTNLLGGPKNVANDGATLVQQAVDAPLWLQLDLATQELFWGFLRGAGLWIGKKSAEIVYEWISEKAKEASSRVGFAPHKIHINGEYRGVEVQVQVAGEPKMVSEALSSLHDAADLVERTIQVQGRENIQGLAIIYRGSETGWIVNWLYDRNGNLQTQPDRNEESE